MTQRQVLIRLSPDHPWEHGMIAHTASEAFEGMMIARARGFTCKVQAMGMKVARSPVTAAVTEA